MFISFRQDTWRSTSGSTSETKWEEDDRGVGWLLNWSVMPQKTGSRILDTEKHIQFMNKSICTTVQLFFCSNWDELRSAMIGLYRGVTRTEVPPRGSIFLDEPWWTTCRGGSTTPCGAVKTPHDSTLWLWHACRYFWSWVMSQKMWEARLS